MNQTAVESASGHAPASARRRMVDAALGLVMGAPGSSRPSNASPNRRRRATRAEARGAEALGIRAVAEAAGVTHAAPLHHFPDRVSLLAAVAAEGQRLLASDLEQARLVSAASGARAILGAMVSTHALWAARHPGLWDVMCNPQLTDGVNTVWRGRTEGRSAEQSLQPAREEGTGATDGVAAGRAGSTAARNLTRRAEAFDELVNAKVRVFETYDAAVYACPAEQLQMARFAGGERRPLVHALTTLADGLSLQFVGEHGVDEAVLRTHVERTLDLLLAGVLRA